MTVAENQKTDDAWAEAVRRAEVLRKLVGRKRSAVLIDWACGTLGIGRTTLYGLLRKFEDDPTIESLLPQKRGWQRNRWRLPPQVEEIIQRRIDECYAQPEGPTLKRLHQEVEADLREAGLPNVDYETVRRRLKKKDRFELMKKREGVKRARDRLAPLKGGMKVDNVLDVVMIDHAKVDVFIVEDDTREVIYKRPWITVAIDVASRMVLGYYLTPEHPSSKSVAMTISHATLPKESWFSRLGIAKVDYPAQGIPHCIHMDNAKEFRAKSLTDACENFGITRQYRPYKRPEYGSYIERYIGTLMKACHLVPGTTKSNPQMRGDYKSAPKATLTFSELERFIAHEIIKYHHDIHSSLDMTPIAKWNDLSSHSLINMPKNYESFNIWLLPENGRQVGKYGISINGLHYRDDILNVFIGDKILYRVKYDPFHVEFIWFFHPISKMWVQIRQARLDFPQATLWEIKCAKSALRNKGRKTRNPDVIKDQILAQRKIINEAKKNCAKARRDAQRLSHSQAGTKPNENTKTNNTEKHNINFDEIDISGKTINIDPRRRLRRFE